MLGGGSRHPNLHTDSYGEYFVWDTRITNHVSCMHAGRIDNVLDDQ
jgi:hypothetical protein